MANAKKLPEGGYELLLDEEETLYVLGVLGEGTQDCYGYGPPDPSVFSVLLNAVAEGDSTTWWGSDRERRTAAYADAAVIRADTDGLHFRIIGQLELSGCHKRTASDG